eukprot:396077_1
MTHCAELIQQLIDILDPFQVPFGAVDRYKEQGRLSVILNDFYEISLEDCDTKLILSLFTYHPYFRDKTINLWENLICHYLKENDINGYKLLRIKKKEFGDGIAAQCRNNKVDANKIHDIVEAANKTHDKFGKLFKSVTLVQFPKHRIHQLIGAFAGHHRTEFKEIFQTVDHPPVDHLKMVAAYQWMKDNNAFQENKAYYEDGAEFKTQFCLFSPVEFTGFCQKRKEQQETIETYTSEAVCISPLIHELIKRTRAKYPVNDNEDNSGSKLNSFCSSSDMELNKLWNRLSNDLTSTDLDLMELLLGSIAIRVDEDQGIRDRHTEQDIVTLGKPRNFGVHNNENASNMQSEAIKANNKNIAAMQQFKGYGVAADKTKHRVVSEEEYKQQPENEVLIPFTLFYEIGYGIPLKYVINDVIKVPVHSMSHRSFSKALDAFWRKQNRRKTFSELSWDQQFAILASFGMLMMMITLKDCLFIGRIVGQYDRNQNWNDFNTCTGGYVRIHESCAELLENLRNHILHCTKTRKNSKKNSVLFWILWDTLSVLTKKKINIFEFLMTLYDDLMKYIPAKCYADKSDYINLKQFNWVINLKQFNWVHKCLESKDKMEFINFINFQSRIIDNHKVQKRLFAVQMDLKMVMELMKYLAKKDNDTIKTLVIDPLWNLASY